MHKLHKITESKHEPSTIVLTTKLFHQVPHPHLLNASKDSDSITSLCSLFQRLITFTVKKYFLIYI